MYSLGFICNFIISLKLLSQCIPVALENWMVGGNNPLPIGKALRITQRWWEKGLSGRAQSRESRPETHSAPAATTTPGSHQRAREPLLRVHIPR